MAYWDDKIYSYCERGGDPSFWAEPINAVSNGAFILAAAAAFGLWLAQQRDNQRVVDLALILLVCVIGTGSFLFHTYATRWASVADVLPITLFMLAYLAYVLKRFVGLGWIFTLLGVVAFYFVLSHADAMRCDGAKCLNGSVGYLPALAVLVLFGAVLLIMRHRAGWYLLSAGAVFALSLTFRTFDKAWCGDTLQVLGGPLGTHFLWHILNATLLYLLLRAAIIYGGGRRSLSG